MRALSLIQKRLFYPAPSQRENMMSCCALWNFFYPVRRYRRGERNVVQGEREGEEREEGRVDGSDPSRPRNQWFRRSERSRRRILIVLALHRATSRSQSRRFCPRFERLFRKDERSYFRKTNEFPWDISNREWQCSNLMLKISAG